MKLSVTWNEVGMIDKRWGTFANRLRLWTVKRDFEWQLRNVEILFSTWHVVVFATLLTMDKNCSHNLVFKNEFCIREKTYENWDILMYFWNDSVELRSTFVDIFLLHRIETTKVFEFYFKEANPSIPNVIIKFKSFPFSIFFVSVIQYNRSKHAHQVKICHLVFHDYYQSHTIITTKQQTKIF